MRQWRVVMMVGVALACIAGKTVPAAEPTGAAAPIIEVPQPEFHFANSIEGQTLSHDFLIRNRGPVPLFIHKLRTD
jgi:hypothetical protein